MSEQIPNAGKPRIVVRGPNVMDPPLIETDSAHLIEFRDSFGELNALMVRVFSDELWGLVTRNDPDWKSMLIRYGYLDDVAKPVEQIIRQGI